MKRKIIRKSKLPKYEFGSYVEDSNVALYKNEKAIQKAKYAAADNPLANGLDMVGNMMMQTGTQMLSQGIGDSLAASNPTLGIGKFMKENSGMFQNLSQNAMNYGQYALQKKNKSFAMGGNTGNIPVEVEGEEVGEMPNGQMLDFQGPSHEQGGIPIALPEGTEIYSKRIKVDGVSMADRKKKREKKTMTLELLFDKNKTDILIKNSLNRTNQNNKTEETADNKIQETVKQLLDNQEGNIEKFYGGGEIGPNNAKLNLTKLKKFHDIIGIKPTDRGYGTTFGPKSLKAFNTGKYESVWDEEGQIENPSFLNNFNTRVPIESVNNLTPIDTTYEQSAQKEINNFISKNSIKSIPKTKESSWTDFLPGVGDAMSIYGNMYQSDKIMDTIMENRNGDTPNINAFKDYGQDGLRKMDESKQYLKGQEANALKDLELSRTAGIKRGRNSARGVNTMRALDIATDMGINAEQSKIFNNTASGMINILGQESQLENDQDRMVMTGEQGKDLADRQDRDNFYSQLITGHKNKGQAISQTGKDLNDIKLNKVKSKLTNDLNDAYDIDENGNRILKPGFGWDDLRKQIFKKDITGENDLSNMTDEQLAAYYSNRAKQTKLQQAKTKK